jgi:hypothetical protein
MKSTAVLKAVNTVAGMVIILTRSIGTYAAVPYFSAEPSCVASGH